MPVAPTMPTRSFFFTLAPLSEGFDLMEGTVYGLLDVSMEDTAYTKEPEKTTVAVGMSGGVDSSVAAALLKEQGYTLVGFFMKNWGDTYGLKESACPWVQDREDAMRVAAKLDIPFHTLDFEEEYRSQVLDYFFKEYEAGRTPNPDVMCNSKIKFGVFLDKALALGADMIATGHYAKVEYSPFRGGGAYRTSNTSLRDLTQSTPHLNPLPKGEGTRTAVSLMKARDDNKDQTYFLHRLDQNQLSRALFPIGEYTKPEVRLMAKRFGLPNYDKRDSQGVCFIGHINLQTFLKQKIKENPGDIVTTLGDVVGKHTGLFWYTPGQRKGINIGGTGPFYVVRKDFETNQLVVTKDPKDDRLYSTEAIIGDVSWIHNTPATPRLKREGIMGRIRYREPLSACAVTPEGDEYYRVVFEKPQWAVASGQSIVLYDGEVCLGGGIAQ